MRPILHACELASEAYRQKCRNHLKSEKCTYLEFTREKVICLTTGLPL